MLASDIEHTPVLTVSVVIIKRPRKSLQFLYLFTIAHNEGSLTLGHF